MADELLKDLMGVWIEWAAGEHKPQCGVRDEYGVCTCGLADLEARSREFIESDDTSYLKG